MGSSNTDVSAVAIIILSRKELKKEMNWRDKIYSNVILTSLHLDTEMG